METGILSSGDELVLSRKEESGVLLLGGTPLNEPVVQHGPFVMNTHDEIRRAVMDYRSGVLTE
ncbi:hypothetical protein ACH42_09515 [Endozoicomonas sp. (ex Bugula neritina AB1)]|nr:hypothetical protein ACH42_09515 [Endozoicomonas sp. (ex Bugula neritina AB1)]